MNSQQLFRCLSLALFILQLLLSANARGAGELEGVVPIRVGWQIPAATQAQVVEVLKRTDVLERHGLEPTLVPFSYGGPQVDAAFEGKLDVIFSGDQPAINLMARGGKWKIVGRLHDDRAAIIVPPNSSIGEVEDLRGKTVASPFGSVGHRMAFRQQQAAGLDPDSDVDNENLDILDIRRRVQAGGVESWGDIDAAIAWEPIVSRFELEGLARTLTTRPTLSVITVSEAFIAAHPQAAVQFLVALARAWEFLSHNSDTVMQWYLEDAHLDYSPDALVAARLDANFSAKSLGDINLDLSAEDIAALEQGAAWARESGEGSVQINRAVDRGLLESAMNEIAAAPFDDIQIILPSSDATRLDEVETGYKFNSAPLSAVFVFTVFIALLAIESGLRLGRHNREKFDDELVRPVATVVGAVLGMMAFVIAFTFGSANNRFDARKAALLEDVTNIQTAYLRANLLPEPQRTTVRSLMRDYVQARAGIIYAYGNPDTLRLVQRRAEALQELMWSHVEALAATEKNPRIQVLFASALNDVFKLHTKRIVLGVHYQIPGFMWIALLAASAVAMFAVGFQFGISGGQRSHTSNLALAITFALVMLLAFDLDRAGEGLITVNQQPMIDLYQSMGNQG